jgi:MoxR-like ATPase
LGYPLLQDEISILDRQQFQHPIETLTQVMSSEEILNAQDEIKKVYVSNPVKRYIVELVRQTRQHPEVYLGASPRGSLALYRTGQAKAAMDGRDFVLPDDIKGLVVPTLSHRVILGPAARLRDLAAEQLLQDVLVKVAVPGGDLQGEDVQ